MAERANTNNAPILEEGVNAYLLESEAIIVVDGIPGYTASGTNTYAITTGKSLTALYAHQAFFVLFTNGNTASSTLNVDGIGAKTLKKSGSTNLASGDIAAGQLLECVYDGTNFQVIGIGGAGGGSGTVNAGTQYRLAHYAATGTAVSEAAAITASRALKSDANGVPTHFDTATEPSMTELSYVKGVTGALQAQMNLKAPLASPTFTVTPTAPTAALLTNTTQLATTAFVQQELNGSNSYIANKISLQLFNSY